MKKKILSIGVLLINVGTPDFPDKKSVRRYLLKFLSDKRILDVFWLLRLFLLYCIILPFRSKRSAKLYQKIWTPKGSPLLVESQKCCHKLSQQLDAKYIVRIGMGNGNPSIETSVDAMLKDNISELIIIPMFPQYAASTTASVMDAVSSYLNTKWHIPPYSFTKPFFQNQYFIEAFKERIQTNIQTTKPDFILFSYHGLPLRHLKKSAFTYGRSPCFNKKKCCDSYGEQNHFCYRAQCFETTKLIADACGLSAHQFTMAFQSRFGKDQWTLPNTQDVLTKLYENGVRKLSVVCPSFVVDCLETLEEIRIQLKKQWLELGGKDLILIDSLNDQQTWILCLKDMIINRDD